MPDEEDSTETGAEGRLRLRDATLRAGNTFGYVGRRSNGSHDLGTSVEASADYALTSQVSLNAFLASIHGGPVVTGTFGGNRLWYGYVESVVTLGAR